VYFCASDILNTNRLFNLEISTHKLNLDFVAILIVATPIKTQVGVFCCGHNDMMAQVLGAVSEANKGTLQGLPEGKGIKGNIRWHKEHFEW
jgi:hypothetical protein